SSSPRVGRTAARASARERQGVKGLRMEQALQQTATLDVDALAEALAVRLQPGDGTPWMNTAEAADYMRVSVRWLRQHLHQVPHSKVEGRLFFSRTELDTWLTERRRS